MTISFNTLKSLVKRHLSVIGKRLYDKEGKNLFSNITTSSAEDPIFDQYLAAAVQAVETVLHQFITSWTDNTTSVTMTLVNTRGDSDFEARTQKFIESYMVLFTVGEYLAMTHPDIAQKYRIDVEGTMQSLVQYVFYKKPPTKSASGYADINGTTT